MKRLVIIDGHAVLYRAFYALPKSLTNRQGQPVNAVYGFSRMLLKVIKNLKPSHLIVAFDLPGPNFRHKLAKDYQATRPKMADDLVTQIKPIQEVVRAFALPIVTQVGFEADDVIGTLAKKVAVEVIIVTGDKDIFQLVDKKTKVFLLKQGISGGELVTEKEVEEKLGIKPEQVVDYKALAGDPSDNYKGVKGIGPKTAKKLLKEFGSLEKIIPTLDKKKQKQALLSRELAQIRCDLKLDLDWQDSELDYNPAAVKEIFEKFRFKSLIKELEKNKQEQMRLL